MKHSKPAVQTMTPAPAAVTAVPSEPRPRPRKTLNRGYNPYDTVTTRIADFSAPKTKRR